MTIKYQVSKADPSVILALHHVLPLKPPFANFPYLPHAELLLPQALGQESHLTTDLLTYSGSVTHNSRSSTCQEIA